MKSFQDEKEHLERLHQACTIKKSETKKLIEEVEAAAGELHNALGAELENEPEPVDMMGQMASNADILKLLMDFLTMVKKLPEVAAGARTDPAKEVIYESELQQLSQ